MSNAFDGVLDTVSRSLITIRDRKRVDYGDTSQLESSIKTEGLINPITVVKEDGGYVLAAGGRRLRALDKLSWAEIPVRVYPEGTDELTLRVVELKENLERKDFEWHEKNAALKEIHELMQAKLGQKKGNSSIGHSMTDTARILGMSVGNLSKDIDLATKVEAIPILKSYENKAQAIKALETAGKRIQTSETLKKLVKEREMKPEDVLQTKLINSYVVKDFFQGIKDYPADHFDFVDLDPPYGINFDSPGTARDTSHLRSDFVEVDSKDYPSLLRNVLHECYRTMKPNSWLIVWYAADPWADTTYREIINAGFMCSRYNGIWKKGAQKGFAPDLRGRLSQSYEPFYYARKGDPGFSITGRYAIFDFEPTVSSEKSHPTEKPLTLMTELLKTFIQQGSQVLVPFAGSGNTLLAASNYTCQGVGFDLSQHYKDVYTKRVLEGKIGEYK